jgi:phosphoribosyl 1,2-cyclic phosphodiesterase
VIDGGSGVRNLGASLQREFADSPCSLNMLSTHFHWDHIQGLPFFAPLYSPCNHVTFHSFKEPEEMKEILEGQMTNPYFPVNFELLLAKRKFTGGSFESFQQGKVSVHAFPLDHPQGACGYRIESDGATIVHASDLEHGDARLDGILRDYCQNADILVMDAQYTPEEYQTKRGWGHSTWLEATRVAADCNVKQLVLFHHDPGHNDAFLDGVVDQARCHFENTIAAKEGWVARV